MGKEHNLGLTPVYSDVLKELFRGNPENHTAVSYKKIKITNKDGLSLFGFLTETSIAIPHYSPLKDENFIKNVVEENWETFHSMGGEKITASFSRFLNTAINTTKNGFHTMDTIIEGVHLIHIYPDYDFDTQEDFVKAFTEAYENEGFEVSIENPSF